MNIFDIIGPIMIGPSSSHTAGAARLGLIARKILGSQPIKAQIDLYGSFAETYKGHGTDLALIAGLLGMNPDDENLPNSFNIAKQKDLDFHFELKKDTETIHPNTVFFHLTDALANTSVIGGISLGGGRVLVTNIDGFPVELTGELPTLLTVHEDTKGIVSKVTALLAEKSINIANMRVSRRQKGGLAAMIIEADQNITTDIVPIISQNEKIKSVRIINNII